MEDPLWELLILFWSVNRDEMSNRNRGPSIDASYQVSVHLAKRLQKRRNFKISQSEIKRVLISSRSINKHGRHRQFLFLIGWFFRFFSSETACLLTDRDKMSLLYRGPFIDASYHVSFHLAMWKVVYKDCTYRPVLLTNMATTGNSCFWLVDF
jgi:hypothetical protein